MGNGDEQFCLRWNDFPDSILSTLQDLRAEEDFVDVTLVCDGEQIRAHKLILSACSDFFRHLLKRNPAANPVIVLWDMSVEDIRNILRFMYNGEVEVQQTHLNTFLSVAERLRVRGLCQSGGKSSPTTTSSPKPSGSTSKVSAGNVGRRSSSPPSVSSHHRQQHHRHHHRRRSHDPEDHSPPPQKKSKSPAVGSGEEVSVKQEGPPSSHPSPLQQQQSSSSFKGEGGSQDENSMMSRSGAESEADYSEFGYGGGAEGYDDHGALPLIGESVTLSCGQQKSGRNHLSALQECHQGECLTRQRLKVCLTSRF
jgi:hypothetical protein